MADRHQLRQARQCLDLTLAEVGRVVGLPRSTISMVEGGSRDMQDVVAKLAAFFESRGIRFGSEGQVHLPGALQKVGGRPVN